MKKKYILIGGIVILAVICLFIFRPKSFEKKADAVFNDMGMHFCKYLDNSINNITHTPEGQAEIYRELLPALKKSASRQICRITSPHRS